MKFAFVCGLLAVGCTDPESDGSSSDGRNEDSGGIDSGTTDSGDSDSGAGETGDTDTGEVELPAAAAVSAEARSGGDAMLSLSKQYGLPVLTQEGWLFLVESNGQPTVAGDFDGWAGTEMTCAQGICAAIIAYASGGYKFVERGNFFADPWSRAYNYDENGEISLIEPLDAHLERHFGVGSASLSQRTVRIWVPNGPVTHTLYAHDGQNLFDPNGISGGWRLQESLPAGMLVAGIDNTADRFDEYTHVPDHLDGQKYGGQGDDYADLIQDEVRPLIRKHYGESAKIGLLGSSLGGLISLHVAQRYPGEYAFAASMSGTLGWGSIEDQNETIIERYAAAGHGTTAIYVDSGGDGTTCADSDGDGTNDDDETSSDNYCTTNQMRDTLAAAGYQFEVDLWHWHEAGAAHNEVYWADRVWRPLGIFAAL